MKRAWKQENNQKMKYDENSKKHRISGNKANYVKQVENAGKIKILNRGINETEIDIMENKVEDDRFNFYDYNIMMTKLVSILGYCQGIRNN